MEMPWAEKVDASTTKQPTQDVRARFTSCQGLTKGQEVKWNLRSCDDACVSFTLSHDRQQPAISYVKGKPTLKS